MPPIKRQPNPNVEDEVYDPKHEDHGHGAVIDDAALQASHDYRPPQPDYSEPYNPAEWEAKARALRNELGDKSVNTGLARDTASPQAQQKDRQDLADLMARYEEAVKESARRQSNKGLIATSMNLSAAGSGDDFLKSQQGYIQSPIEAELGRLKQAQTGTDLNKRITEQYALDEDNDPASMSSNAARNIAKKYGILDEDNTTATAAQIRRVAPFVTAEMKGQQRHVDIETQETGKQVRQTQAEEAKAKAREDQQEHQRALQAQKDAASKERTEIAGRFGIGRTVIAGTFGQEKSQAKGSIAVTKSSDSMTHGIPKSMSFFGDNQYFVRKDGLGADPNASNTLNKLSFEGARYIEAVNALDEIYRQITNNDRKMAPQIFNKMWPVYQAAMAEVQQKNIKYNGNGVANGPDLEQAAKQIGNETDFIQWMRHAGSQYIANAKKSIQRDYMATTDALGYVPSKNPHPITSATGTGGTSATKAPLNPAMSESANAAASMAGLPSPFSSQPTGRASEPQTITTTTGKKGIVGPNGRIRKVK